MGIDIFLAIVGLVVACAATWFIIRYFLMPSGSTDAKQGQEGDGGEEPARDEWTDMGRRIDGLDAERHHLVRLAIISTILTAPVLILDLFGRFAPDDLPSWLANPWIQAILITPVLFHCGRGIILDGWSAIQHRRCTPNLLATLATGIAYLYSLATCVAGSLLPEGSRSPYFDVVGVVITLLLLARILEVRTHSSLARSYELLARTRPGSGRVLDTTELKGLDTDTGDESWSGLTGHQVAQDDIATGSLLLVRQGERLADDGQVVAGSATIDEKELTGAEAPVRYGPGDHVLASTKLVEGNLIIRVEASGNDTYVSRLMQVIPDALTGRSPAVHTIDRKIHTAIAWILVAAVWTLMAWLLFGPDPNLAHAVASAFCVLAVACPTAATVTVPLAFRTALNTGIQNGVLFTSPKAMSNLSRVAAVAVDDSALTDQSGSSDRAQVYEESLIRASTHLRSLRVMSLVLDGTGAETDEASGHSTSTQIERAARVAGVDMLVTQLSDTRKAYCLERLIHDLGKHTGDAPSDGIEDTSRTPNPDRLVALAANSHDQPEAMKRAQVHISFGTRPGRKSTSDTEPDLILRNGDLDGIARAIELSQATKRVVKENLTWSTVYNIAALIIASGILYPLFGWMLNPMIAPAAAAIAAILPMANTRRLHHLTHLRRRWRGLAQIDTDHLPTVAARRPQIIVDSQWNPDNPSTR
nr:hypothetical protein [Bifidobacterium indicum]